MDENCGLGIIKISRYVETICPMIVVSELNNGRIHVLKV